MSTGQSAVTLCGWGVKEIWFIPLVDKRNRWQVKLCDPSLTRAIPERFREEFIMIKLYTNLRLLFVKRSSGTVFASGCVRNMNIVIENKIYVYCDVRQTRRSAVAEKLRHASFMAALCNKAGHIYFFILSFVLSFFFLLFFFPRLISAVADWMSAILAHMVWPCEFKMQV